ncbi:MAG: hypothetical protein QOE11_3751 [Solirubrobacteraceae bacterium]|nr:hypothetical protein [Solirubrobacteraceae bacterium]
MTVDPSSPSGREYAIPVERARQQASKHAKKKTGTTTTPLFGEGVNDGGSGGTTPSAAAKPKSAAASKAKAPSGAKGAQSKARADAAAQAQAAAAIAAARVRELARARDLRAEASAPQGGIGIGGIIAVGVAVLLVGGLIGLWLRRRATTP